MGVVISLLSASVQKPLQPYAAFLYYINAAMDMEQSEKEWPILSNTYDFCCA